MVTRNEIEKISLSAKELFMVMYPKWLCFGYYNQEECGLKCTKRTHLLCCKVTLFLGRAK